MSKTFTISSLDKSLGRIFSDFRNSLFKAHWLSLIELICKPIRKFHTKDIVWHIKIDSLTAFWIKWCQNGEKHYRLICSSLVLNWAVLELVLKFHIPYWLWYIKIDHFHDLSIKWGQKGKNPTSSLLAQVSGFEGSFQIFILNIGCDISK